MIKLIEMLLFGHFHKWEECSYLNFYDTSFGARMPSQKVTYRCEICKKHKTEIAEGFRD